MATKPVYATCSCEANLSQLRMDWNTQLNPDLIDIHSRLMKISQDHLTHAPDAFEQFQNQYVALLHRFTTEVGSPSGILAGARMAAPSSSSPSLSSRATVVSNPSAPPAQRSKFYDRQDTHQVAAPIPPRSASQPRSSSSPQPRTGFRITAQAAAKYDQKPSSDTSKKTEGHD